MGEIKNMFARDCRCPAERVACNPLPQDYFDGINEDRWWAPANLQNEEFFMRSACGAEPSEEQVRVLKERRENFLQLNKLLLAIGGEVTCFADFHDEELEKVVERGFYCPGKSRRIYGRECACHDNVFIYWKRWHHQKILTICTGYALSEDGIWRKHSWLIERYQLPSGTCRERILESTVKRVAYFGCELTYEESLAFGGPMYL